MKKPGKYLKFYYECMETGQIPDMSTDTISGGLCSVFGPDVMRIFTPTKEDCIQYNVEAKSYYCYDFEWSQPASIYFGPTRQNVVLFLAAMKGEL